MTKSKLFKRISFSVAVIFLAFFIVPCMSYMQTEDELPDSSKDIVGYQIGGETYYGASIYWVDNMTFIYDHGEYDTTEGKMVSSFPEPSPDNKGVITNDMVEKGAEQGNIEKWYGFDGIRNRIIVLNRSNADISAKYSAEIMKETVGDKTKLELYDYSFGDIGNNYLLEIEQDPTSEGYGVPKDYGDAQDRIKRFGNELQLDSDEKKIILASKEDGTAYANKVFFNLTGAPRDDFTLYSGDSTIPETIGSITITLDKDTTTNT